MTRFWEAGAEEERGGEGGYDLSPIPREVPPRESSPNRVSRARTSGRRRAPGAVRIRKDQTRETPVRGRVSEEIWYLLSAANEGLVDDGNSASLVDRAISLCIADQPDSA